jgi:ATP-dependent exoDNAse (exonuclease V) beta subunit
VADAAERERALDPRRSFLVDAPAGSGKTELLIQRYLTLLAFVESPEAVVAITFTVKAASEMRSRVVDALRTAARAPRPDAAHAALTWDLAAAVLQRDRARGWNLGEYPNRMRIQTIDALCASITRQMPWLSRFGAQPEVTEHAEDLYGEAARNLVARMPEPLAALLARLDNKVQSLIDLLMGMLQRREQWLRHVVGGAPRAELESALTVVIRDELTRLRESVPAAHAREIIDLAALAACYLPDPACRGLRDLPGTRPEDVPAWKDIAALLLKADTGWRNSVDVRNGFPPDRREDKRRFRELVAALREDAPELRDALAGLRRLPLPVYDEAQWRALEALFQLLPLVAAELQLVFRERGVVDFSEVSQRALLALGGEESPTDLALAMDYRIQHLLVDEFQDTSLSQYRLLEQLTAGWEPGDGRTLFLVGDPMQSIYRFREAEVGLFLRARREGIGGVALEPLRLIANFRSERGIVDWVNQAFAAVFPGKEEITTGAVTYNPSVAQNESGRSAVQVHPFLARNDRGEAERVVALAVQDAAANPGGKTAILARARTHLPDILRALKRAGLRYRAIEIDELGARPLVQDLLALTRALLHAGDRTAWLAVLRAPWCGLTLADLHALAGQDPYAAVWDLICDPERAGRLSGDGQSRLERVRDVLGTGLRHSRRLPLRTWVESAWMQLGGPACLGGAADWEDAQAFFQLLEGLEEGGEAPSLEALAEKVKGLFAAPDLEAEESLQVLTIHKAKGIEFDTVILPGLGRTPPADDARLLNWFETTGGRGESLLLLAPIKAAGAENDEIGRYLRHIDRKKEEHEAVRLLYVAATRARRKLHLLGHVPVRGKDGSREIGKPEAGSLLQRLWPMVEGEFLARGAAIEPVPGPVPAQAVRIRRLASEWSVPAPPAAVEWQSPLQGDIEPASEVTYAWVGVTLRNVGTVVQRALRRLAETGAADWRPPVIRAALAGLGTPPAEIDAAAAQVERALANTTADPRGRWILQRGGTGARSEYGITGLVEGRLVEGVIDRTFVDGGVRWIIDFKTGAHSGGGLDAFLDEEQRRHAPQLEAYAALFAQMEDRPIRLGLYFPLLGGWRGWPY